MNSREFCLNAFLGALERAMVVNTKTGTVRFVKSSNSTIKENKEYSFREYLDWAMIAGKVYAEDYPRFNCLTDLDVFREMCKKGEGGRIVSYRRVREDNLTWCAVFLVIPDDYSDENPNVLLAGRGLTSEEAEQQNVIVTVGDASDRIQRANIERRNSSNSQFWDSKYAMMKLLQNFNMDFLVDLLAALSLLLRKFKEFFIVDLEKDEYSGLKLDKHFLESKAPLIGCYSKEVTAYMVENYGEGARAVFENIDSTEKLRKKMNNKLVLNYAFDDSEGKKVLVGITKISNTDNEPSKLVFRMMGLESTNKLKIKTFGAFDVFDTDGGVVKFSRGKAKQVFAYLVDKHGYSVTTRDLVVDVLEKDEGDKNAIKYVSTLINSAMNDLEKIGFQNVIIKGRNSFRVNIDEIDCDYYKFLDGDVSAMIDYHNEYMKDYSWAEETNADIMCSDLW